MPKRFEVAVSGHHFPEYRKMAKEPDVTFFQIASKATAIAAGIATAGILAATTAFADPEVVPFGQQAEIPSPGGAINYTVGNLQPSGHNDGVWFSDVTAQAVSGSPTPNIADFNARAVNSSTFAVMKGNETDGLPNGPLAVGTQATGKLYFNVRNGTSPDSVVYRDAGGTDKVVWKG
jgi:hypothetical protein